MSLIRSATALVVILSAAPAARADDQLSGRWVGEYTCYQGLTSMELDLEANLEGWSGTFAFGPHPTNPDIPEGSYFVSVTLKKSRVFVSPSVWIDQPEGYVTVPMTGTLSPDASRIEGTMQFDGCDRFTVARAPDKAK